MSKEELESCCAVHCNYIVPTVGAITSLSMIPAVYVFIAARIKGKLKSSKRIFYAGLVFFILIFLTLIWWSIFAATICEYPQLTHIAHNVFQQFYTVENMLFVAILFDRLFKIFENTEFKIHRCTVRAFITYYVIAASLVAAYGILNVNSSIIETFGDAMSLIGSVIGLLGLILIVWIMALYLYKLTQVYKHKADDEQLLPIITKTSVLCVWSTVATLLMIVGLMMLGVNHSAPQALMHCLLVLTDVYTNFLCVWLSYSKFQRQYKRVCRCCHMQCQRLWMWHFHRGDEMKMMELHSTTSRVLTARSPSVASATSRNFRYGGNGRQEPEQELSAPSAPTMRSKESAVDISRAESSKHEVEPDDDHEVP